MLTLAQDWGLLYAFSAFVEVHGKLKFVQKGQNLAVMNRMTFTL